MRGLVGLYGSGIVENCYTVTSLHFTSLHFTSLHFTSEASLALEQLFFPWRDILPE
jgi:hypothetical protein